MNGETVNSEDENKSSRNHAADQANKIAADLEALAARIRQTANQFSDESRPAAAIVADIVNDYTQGTAGSTGARLWSLVRELSRMR